MAQQNITPNNPPILWSTVDEAFQKINANFTELYLSIGGSGADLTSIPSSIIPDANAVRDLGSEDNNWNIIWATELRLGAAEITTNQTAINIPAGSTIDGELIRNPDESSFKTIRIAGQSDVVANDFQSVVNFSGTGIDIATNPATDTVAFINAGVTGAAAGTGIGVSSATGVVTISNTGVVSAVAGDGIGVSAATGVVTFSNTGVRQVAEGIGITVNFDPNTGQATISNSAPNVAQNVYRFIAVESQPILDPVGPLSTLNIAINGDGLLIISDPVNNLVTFSNTGVTNISVDDAFNISSGTGSVSLSLNATLRRNLIGDVVGSVFSDGSTLLLDGTGGVVVGPVRNDVTDIKVFGGNVGEVLSTDGAGNLLFVALPDLGNITFTGNVITSADSSEVVVGTAAVFNSDVTVENDLIVRNLLTVEGSIAGYTSTATLKAIIADSADFDDFQARIAAL